MRLAGGSLLCAQLLILVLAFTQLNQFIDDFLGARLETSATGVADEIARRGGNAASFREVASSFLTFNPGVTVLFIDARGAILQSFPTVSGTVGPSEEISRSFSPILPSSMPRLKTASIVGYDALFSSAPAFIERVNGVVLVLFPKAYITLNTTLGGVVFFSIVGAIVSLLIVRMLVRSQLRGVMTVANAARGYLSGREGDRVPMLPPGEVNDLGSRFNDLTEGSRVLQNRIASTETERRALLAGLVHDLSAPVTSIVGFLALAKETLARASIEEARDHVRRVLRATERLTPLILNLGKLGEVELERTMPQIGAVDLARLLAQTVETLQGSARRKSLTIELSVHSIDSVIEGDEELLRRVFENLLSNALRFTLAGGAITVRLEDSGTGLSVAVKDSGVGIAEEQLPEIFKEYVQGAPMNEQREGVGLGLALVKRFVSIHQGTVSVQSALGVGSTFTVLLPRVATLSSSPVEDGVAGTTDRVSLSRLALHALVGAIVGLLPALLGDPIGARYVAVGVLVGLFPLLSARIVRSPGERFAMLIAYGVGLIYALGLLRRYELVLLGLGSALLVSVPLAFSLVRSFALGIASRIGYALLASVLVNAFVLTSWMWMHVSKERTSQLLANRESLVAASRTYIERVYQDTQDIERALYSFQAVVPFRAAVLLDGSGAIAGESNPHAVYQWFDNATQVMAAPSEALVTVFSAAPNAPGPSVAVVTRAMLASPMTLALVLDNVQSQQYFARLFESTAFQMLAVGGALAMLSGAVLAVGIQRLIRPRLAYAFKLLAGEGAEPPPGQSDAARCDEIDEILIALRSLSDGVRRREQELQRAQRRRCDLISRIHHSLAEPLEELRFQLAQFLNDAGDVLAASPTSLNRAAEIVDAEHALLRELSEYARTSGQLQPKSQDLFRVDELLQDIFLKLEDGGTPVEFVGSGAAPFVELHVFLVDKVVQLVVGAYLSELPLRSPLRCKVSREGAEVLVEISGPDGAVDPGGRRDVLFAEIRRAIVEGYLEQMGGSISETIREGIRSTRISFPAA